MCGPDLSVVSSSSFTIKFLLLIKVVIIEILTY